MTLAPTRQLIDAAVTRGVAVPAFNVIGLEHAEAIAEGAARADSAVILQLSENAVRFRGGLEPLLAACREIARAAPVPVALHLDHVESADLVDHTLAVAAEFGVGSIMFDASTLGYAENVTATASVASRAHELGLWVEAELGAIGGKGGAHTPGVRTDPDEARSFVAATGVDGLAVAVGSSHAMTERSASIDLGLTVRLAAAVPVPLVLHGSSGVPDDVLARAVAAGIRKVNVGTALNVAYTTAVREVLEEHPDVADPRVYVSSGREAMAGVVDEFCRLLAGSTPVP